MRAIKTSLPDVLLFEPKVSSDGRGFFFESYNRRELAQFGVDVEFVQDNHSRSARHVLRGLHYQIQQPQGKLVRVISGEIFDVVVDIRRSSPAYGKWEGFHLSSDNRRIAWVPPGFVHGFLVLSNHAEVLYKATDYWAPQFERCIRWDDPKLAIKWPLAAEPILSEKDRMGKAFGDAEVFE